MAGLDQRSLGVRAGRRAARSTTRRTARPVRPCLWCGVQHSDEFKAGFREGIIAVDGDALRWMELKA